jgi:hypothetical protein
MKLATPASAAATGGGAVGFCAQPARAAASSVAKAIDLVM